MLITSRRSFLGGLLSALAAPAIVHASNIMPVRNVLILPELPAPWFDSFDRLVPNGRAYQWVSDVCDVMPGAGWEPVKSAPYKSQFAIPGDHIEVGGLILMERSEAACIAAREKEIESAKAMRKYEREARRYDYRHDYRRPDIERVPAAGDLWASALMDRDGYLAQKALGKII